MLFIADDGPIARDDTDGTQWVVDHWVATGNVLTGAGTTSGVAGQDQHEGMQDGAKAEVVQVRGRGFIPYTLVWAGLAKVQLPFLEHVETRQDVHKAS